MRRDEERDVRERPTGGAEAVERVGDGARPVLRRRRPAHHRDADEEDERRDGHRTERDARAADLELALLVEREDGERQPVPQRAASSLLVYRDTLQKGAVVVGPLAWPIWGACNVNLPGSLRYTRSEPG